MTVFAPIFIPLLLWHVLREHVLSRLQPRPACQQWRASTGAQHWRASIGHAKTHAHERQQRTSKLRLQLEEHDALHGHRRLCQSATTATSVRLVGPGSFNRLPVLFDTR